jgi:glucose-6-phosphate isomerase
VPPAFKRSAKPNPDQPSDSRRRKKTPAQAQHIGPVRSFADEIKSEDTRDIVILGMGGSSLCVETMRQILPLSPGHARLHILDSTHPDDVSRVERDIDLAKTLFVVASKSGSTIEPNCLLDYFWDLVSRQPGLKAGRHFIAITDPGTSLEKMSHERSFRKTFLNPSDVGGRFSALTLFGLVPAVLAGADASGLLSRARATAKSCSPKTPTRENPGLRLGAALGGHARAGRDKLTLVLDPGLEALGAWIEQLVAESTGKDGLGLLPIVAEPLGKSDQYNEDRFFVRLSLKGHSDSSLDKKTSALEQAGHPVLRLELADELDLGTQFFLWEIATAAAGFILGVNPFDQPDVQSTKDRVNQLLKSLEAGALPAEKADFRSGSMATFCDADLKSALKATPGQDRPLREVLDAHFSRVGPKDYVCLLAFLSENDENRRILEEARQSLRTRVKAPVTISWGPRYLHSTGQLYKGGSKQGVFVIFSDSDKTRLAIPGRPYSFGTLCRAQARADASATIAASRRVILLDLGAQPATNLRAVANALTSQATSAR